MPRKRKGADLSYNTTKCRRLRDRKSKRTEEQIQQQNTDARVRMAKLRQKKSKDTRAEHIEVIGLEQRQSRLFTVNRRRTNDQQRQQSKSKEKKLWMDIPENHQENNYKTKAYDPDSLDCQMSKNEPGAALDESNNWETKDENICQVFVKSELIYEEELELEEKPSVIPPTNEEMLEALKILSTGVKHRTNNLQIHYEYEHFIYQLLNKVV